MGRPRASPRPAPVPNPTHREPAESREDRSPREAAGSGLSGSPRGRLRPLRSLAGGTRQRRRARDARPPPSGLQSAPTPLAGAGSRVTPPRGVASRTRPIAARLGPAPARACAMGAAGPSAGKWRRGRGSRPGACGRDGAAGGTALRAGQRCGRGGRTPGLRTCCACGARPPRSAQRWFRGLPPRAESSFSGFFCVLRLRAREALGHHVGPRCGTPLPCKPRHGTSDGGQLRLLLGQTLGAAGHGRLPHLRRCH